MSAAEQIEQMSVQEYLSSELDSPIKREFLGGIVYSMSGARNAHNMVATNITGAIWTRLRGKPCRSFNSDTKIRIRLPGHTRFYYPDASVVCRLNPPNDAFQDEPAVVVEVLSESTKRVDMGEKKDAYLSIPSLSVYVLVDPERAAVICYRRTEDGFMREVFTSLDSTVSLPEIGVDLPLAEIYENVTFSD